MVHVGGEKVFVDYSRLTMPIYNQRTEEVDYAQIFVAVLDASGYTFVQATPFQRQEYFIHSHVLEYQFFGGMPRIVVQDNLKSAIISHNKNGIVFNECYSDLARHYRMAIEPARPSRKCYLDLQAIIRSLYINLLAYIPYQIFVYLSLYLIF